MFIEISQFYIKSHFAYFLQQTDMATRNMNSNPKGPNILITGMWYCNKSMRWVIQKLWLISGIWFHLWQTFSSQKIPIFLGHCCCVFVWNDCLVVVGLLNELPLQKGKFIGLLAWFYVFNFNLSGCWLKVCTMSQNGSNWPVTLLDLYHRFYRILPEVYMAIWQKVMSVWNGLY